MAKSLWQKIKVRESSVSLVLGILVVVTIGALIFNFISRQRKPAPKPEVTTEEQAKEKAAEVSLPTKYTVVEGDHLWKISEKYFKTGYNWPDIARENNLASPDLIAVGMELVIPAVEPVILPTTGVVAPKAATAIAESTYTVARGDNLWEIAVRAYGDGYKLVEIAKANNLADPDIIHAGNVLTLPR